MRIRPVPPQIERDNLVPLGKRLLEALVYCNRQASTVRKYDPCGARTPSSLDPQRGSVGNCHIVIFDLRNRHRPRDQPSQHCDSQVSAPHWSGSPCHSGIRRKTTIARIVSTQALELGRACPTVSLEAPMPHSAGTSPDCNSPKFVRKFVPPHANAPDFTLIRNTGSALTPDGPNYACHKFRLARSAPATRASSFAQAI